MGKEVYLAKRKEGFLYLVSRNEDKKYLKYEISGFENLRVIPFEEFGTMVPAVEVVKRAREIGAEVIAQERDGEDYSYTCFKAKSEGICGELEKRAMPYRPGETVLAD
jgi:hypothetical protein